jgi:hypothetical protein
LAVPGFLKSLWNGWKAFAHKLGVVQTFIMMTVFYFLVLGVARLVYLVTRRDMLHLRKLPGTAYRVHEPQPDTVERLSHLS